MKKDRGKQILKKEDYEKFEWHDTRYFGLFYKKVKQEDRIVIKDIKVDIKRFLNTTGHKFNETQLNIINKRQTHYFYPKKNDYCDYMCNVFNDRLDKLTEYWNAHYKKLIKYAKNRIKKPIKATPGNTELFMQGVLEYDEAVMVSNFENFNRTAKYEAECAEVVASLYAQYVHQLASQVEAVTVYVLSNNNVNVDHFSRNTLYGTSVGKDKKVQDLSAFVYYDKLYCLWNFIKHNSKSTYDKIKESYPEFLFENAEFIQGQPAYKFIRFSDELVMELLNGCREFFKEYCLLVFSENYDEAQWNYGRYFFDIVKDSQDMVLNPLGLPWYL